MPGYARRPDRKHTAGLGGRLGNRAPAERQTIVSAPVPYGARVTQNRIDNWDAGTQAYEADRRKWGQKRHRFVPMGSWDQCDKCGQPHDVLLLVEGGHVPLHREPIPKGKRR